MSAEDWKTLRELLDNEGWHGSGEKDREELYCEHCGQHALCSESIQHTPQCIHARATAALGRLEAEAKHPGEYHRGQVAKLEASVNELHTRAEAAEAEVERLKGADRG